PAETGLGNPAAPGGAGGVAQVTIETFAFAPDPLEVPAGTTITFTNLDMIDHTATAGTRDEPQPEVFDGALPDRGATFELALDEPGTYAHVCRIHDGPGMTGRLVVT